jgi:hypothetical protein
MKTLKLSLLKLSRLSYVYEVAMNKVTETRRALFEAWYAKRYGKPDENDTWAMASFYDSQEAFNAGLDAVEIKMPNTTANTGLLTSSAVLSYKRECRAAIKSTNLGLRIK